MSSSTTTTLHSRISPFLRLLEKTGPIVFFAFATGASSLVRIPVPGSPIPVTLQSSLVLASGLFLGARNGALSQALYLLLGVLGLPFFAASATMIGPTGGYLIGFILASFLSGRAARVESTKFGVFKMYLLTLAASLGIFIPGIVWLKIYSAQSWINTVQMGFTPFIIGDLVKTALAVSFYSGLCSALRAAREAARIRKKTVL